MDDGVCRLSDIKKSAIFPSKFKQFLRLNNGVIERLRRWYGRTQMMEIQPEAPMKIEARVTSSESPWMTPAQTAVYLGIALGTLRNWTSARYVPHARRGRVVRYHRATIDEWLARGACIGRSTIADLRGQK